MTCKRTQFATNSLISGKTDSHKSKYLFCHDFNQPLNGRKIDKALKSIASGNENQPLIIYTNLPFTLNEIT